MENEIGLSSQDRIMMLKQGQISAEEAGAIVIEIKANPKPSNKTVHCGFGHMMRYGRYDFPFPSEGKIYFAPNIPAYVCDSCGVKILPKEVGDELIEKVNAVNATSGNIPQA